LGAGGATSFVFDGGEVYQWRMNIQGSQERILDSVLPHEVTHTIFATHFRRPLPRWADEGASTTVEHGSERAKQDRMLIEFLQTRRGIPFSRMFAMTEYPSDVMPLYSQGYSLARFLIGHGGKRRFIQYIEDGLNSEQWVETTRRHYHFENLAGLQDSWLDWVRNGSPALRDHATQPDVLLASATQPSGDDVLARSQSPDVPAEAALADGATARQDGNNSVPQDGNYPVPQGGNNSVPQVGNYVARQDGNVVPAGFANVAGEPNTVAASPTPFSVASARSDNVPGGDPRRVVLEWSISSSQRDSAISQRDSAMATRGPNGGAASVPPQAASEPRRSPSSGGFTAPTSGGRARMAGQRPTMLR
jgi:hypothetical protein